MSRYVDAKIRTCPKCNLNVNDCKCQDNNVDNRVRFVELSQATYDELIKKEQQNKEE